MTRTQISLDDRQYRFLKSEAARRDTSLSAVLRELVEQRMLEADAGGPSIMALSGLFHAGDLAGADHDRVLVADLERRKVGRPAPRSGE